CRARSRSGASCSAWSGRGSTGSSLPPTSASEASGSTTCTPSRKQSAPPRRREHPWFVVPADNKWFTRLIVAAAIVEAVENLDLSYPKIDAAKKKELVAARAALARER